MTLWIVRVAGVIALLVAASLLATPKGRLPLALRGLKRTLARDGACAVAEPAVAPPSAARRLAAFLLVILAVLLAAL